MANANFTVDRDAIDQIFDNLDVSATVGYAAEYAAYVEFPTSYSGTSPPFAPIFGWVDRKWVDLQGGLKNAVLSEDEDGNTRPSPGSEEHKKKVAWLVVNAIAESGTDGVFFLNRGFEAAKQAAPQYLEAYKDTDDPEAARKAIEDTLDFAFEKSQDIVADEASDRGTLLQSGFVVVDQNGQEVFTKGSP